MKRAGESGRESATGRGEGGSAAAAGVEAEAPSTPDMRGGSASAGESSRRPGAVPDHTSVTPHTLAPEAYHDALSREPGIFTIGTIGARPRHWHRRTPA